jgi:hypothetical protein
MPPVTINGDTGIVTPMYNGSITANAVTPSVNMKNRIINGAMVIDQRNAGASVSGNNNYTLDRWQALVSASGKYTVQQDAGAVTPPAGFTDYLGVTSSSAYSVASGDYFTVTQRIEGYNIADLGWGTANAKTVTLSFWVRSSLTGTFGGSLRNASSNRSYPFSYTISAATTWEYKTITIAGDTSGTWGSTNGTGIELNFSMGAGTAFSGTAGAWAGTNLFSATGATSVVGTNGATFYITGVQLEVGSTATSFDYRPYGTELQLCQRYYYRSTQYSTFSPVGVGRAWSGTTGNAPFYLPVPMRASQTITYSALSDFDIVTVGSPTSIGNDGSGPNNVKIGWAKSSGVTSGALYQFEFGNTTSGWLGFSAEL